MSAFDPLQTLRRWRAGLRCLARQTGREFQVKNRTAFFALRGPDTSTMVFDDGSAERQAQAPAARFCGVERIEDVLQLIGCDSGAGVTDVQLDALTIQAG